MEWKEAWSHRSFRIGLLVTVVSLFTVLQVIIRVMDFMETQPGAQLHDPILALLPPTDLTWPLTFLIYSNLILLLWGNLYHPRELLISMQTYTLMVLTRIVTLYTFPLEAPDGIIPLLDPFVQWKSESGFVHTKDLFFSGHTATVFICFLTTVSSRLRIWFLIATALVGFFVLLQHVHYTIDVVAAPFVSYLCYKMVLVTNEKLAMKGSLS
ncbi:MAG: sphingomyelin synthase family protein [Flavobacteriales bacterium]|nr:sphingomyelin synthase family protein [Flavobacteriales bacterium]